VRTALSLWLIGAVLLSASLGLGQPRFRVTYTPRPREGSALVLDGRVSNDADREVLDVWVTAEALNASGKVLATGLGFVSSSIRGHGSATFVVKVPFVEGVQTFRVAVTSHREGGGGQSP
jgi:hypothetical protein